MYKTEDKNNKITFKTGKPGEKRRAKIKYVRRTTRSQKVLSNLLEKQRITDILYVLGVLLYFLGR